MVALVLVGVVAALGACSSGPSAEELEAQEAVDEALEAIRTLFANQAAWVDAFRPFGESYGAGRFEELMEMGPQVRADTEKATSASLDLIDRLSPKAQEILGPFRRRI